MVEMHDHGVPGNLHAVRGRGSGPPIPSIEPAKPDQVKAMEVSHMKRTAGQGPGLDGLSRRSLLGCRICRTLVDTYQTSRSRPEQARAEKANPQ